MFFQWLLCCEGRYVNLSFVVGVAYLCGSVRQSVGSSVLRFGNGSHSTFA